MTRIERVTSINLPAPVVWDLLNQSKTLEKVAWPVMTYRPVTPLPPRWHVGFTTNIRPRFAGILPTGIHLVTFDTIDADNLRIVTHETGGAIREWNHTMQVHDIGEHRSVYVDTVDIDAGDETDNIVAFAKFFYRHRHRRWQRLAAEYDELVA